MKISKEGLDFIKSFESFVGYVYDDKVAPVHGAYREWKGEKVRGTLTIGYGHTNAARHPLKISLGLRITEPEACDVLDVDLDDCETDVLKSVKKPLTQGQYDALTSFDFNCGAGNLKKLIIPLNQGDYKATRDKFDLYVKSKGTYMRGLQRRRDGEQALWDEHEVSLPTEIVHHPDDVEAVKLPLKIDPKTVGEVAVLAVGGTGTAVAPDAPVDVSPALPVPAAPLPHVDPSPLPAPPDWLSPVSQGWHDALSGAHDLFQFASHHAWFVGAAVAAYFAITRGLPALQRRFA